MAEYQQSATVKVPADRVFQLVSDVQNLPKYLPTLQRADPEGQGRVHLEGNAYGHHYEGSGSMRVDQASRRMEWGSDEGITYRGWLQVKEAGASSSEVTIHLSFSDAPPMTKVAPAGGPDPIQQALEQTLQAIRALCEVS